jgi:serine/threonine protein kinase
MAAQLGMHLSPDALRGVAMGTLDAMTAGAIMTHLDGCPDCCRAVAALSSDDFLDRLRQAHLPGSTPAAAETPAGAARVLTPAHTGASPPGERGDGVTNLPPELANNPQYAVLRELGRGGMGVVYLAKNKLMDRLEVLKVVNRALLVHPGAMDRFLREIRSAARLSHANVVAAYSAVQSGELLAFAMEYVEGQDLARLVQAHGPLPVANACDYIKQAALGMQHAFEKDMVHRDIKPQNLILARAGERHIVKVLDFGLAKVTRAANQDTTLTDDGAMLGTPGYVAPEQTLDATNADIRADIYSLGCTLYYLLTGTPPFEGRSAYEVLQAHQSLEARPLNQVRPEVPEELAAVVRKMMAKDPARRYQTPMALAQALDALAVDTPKPSPARKWVISGGIAAGVLVIGLLGLWAGSVLRVKTPEGTLVVKVNVPNPDMYVDGEKVIVSWDKSGKEAEIRVRAGKQVEVELKKQGFGVFGKQVTLTDGGSRVLEAWLEQQPVPDGPAASASGDDGRRAGDERDDNLLKMRFCWCPTRMIPGSTPRTPGIHAQGFHMPGIWMGKYEVTQSEWARLMGSMPSHAMDKGEGDRHPIYYVSHDDVTEFCQKLAEQERKAGRMPKGWIYQLPTDDQWEYACRAGTTTATAFGDKMDSTQANFGGNWPYGGAPQGPDRLKAVAVGSLRPNAWGLYDMHGNVGEFVAARGRTRGGSWCDSGRNCCSEIFIPNPGDASAHVGFRVALVRN